jgi:polysaccharide chain length determinant protein (PEP-CTERM system associated)
MRELYELLLTYVGGVWRYRWYALLLAWLVCIVGWGVIYQLPDQFRAAAKMHVDTQSMLDPLLRGLTVSTNTSQRVQLVTRTLLARPNLEKLARMTDLDLGATTPEAMEGLLDELGDSIEISTARQKDIYTISYPHREPQVAKRVVQSLLTIFVESTLGEGRQDTDSAQEFVEQQIRDYEAKLQAAERKLAEFKRKNVGQMPGSTEGYYGRLQAANAELNQAQLSLREAENQRKQIKQQLEDDEDSYMLYSEFMPDTGSALDIRIQGLTERMDELLLRYTEKHPDVVEIRRLLEELEEQRLEEQALMDDLDMGPADNPVYQQMKMQLAQADATVASMRTRVSEYERRVEHLQEMVNTIPLIEAEFKQLNRDYNVNQKNYQQLLSRREAANMAEQAEMSGDQVKFRAVEPPRVPLSASEPNRPLLMTGVLLVALAAGVGLGLLLYLLRPTVDNPRTVMQVLGKPVLGVISMIHGEGWGRQQRTAMVAFSVAGLGLFVAYGMAIALAGLDFNLAEITSTVTGRG